jgi:hypothetical protein
MLRTCVGCDKKALHLGRKVNNGGGGGGGLRGEWFVSDKKQRQITEETRTYLHISKTWPWPWVYSWKKYEYIQREIQVHVKTLLSGVISSSVPIC